MTVLAIILLTGTLVVVFALLAAAGVAKLARLDGATYPAALVRAATTFTAVLTLEASLIGTLVQCARRG
ncbi:hypothetical protein E6R60_36190 [Streptomyces sp. A0642]|uniref:hypothetical protein n=1 Tax=Streptomyces sp. A0642 TaxID=2563100 RepID=UPI0010A28501|nr:hypothetical protein [Streptomyces sp. A0642]THA61531.1 hypothetical protein E6R60_36190 [Streptomyces sp. A0642]